MGNALRPSTPGEAARFACVLEVVAPKPGNVHPGAAFDDATWQDFVDSAVAITESLETVESRGIGAAVYAAVEATVLSVGHNTNLGMILLLAPLCAAASRSASREPNALQYGLRAELSELSIDDATAVYQAIALASPGGLGKAHKGDVTAGEVLALHEAMRLAADRDAIARQYVTGFDTVFTQVVPDLVEQLRMGNALDDAIVQVHVQQMAREPDSLILRKCGSAIAAESQRRAQTALDAEDRHAAFAQFDQWLRDPGPDGRAHARNPGTTADLIAAALFVVLWTAQVPAKFTWNGSPHPRDVMAK